MVLTYHNPFKLDKGKLNMAEKLNHIWFPLSFEEVDLPETDSAKFKVLIQYQEKWALINDTHHTKDNGYLFARIKVDEKDHQCYYAQRPDQNGNLTDVRMHYHDLEGLLVPGQAGLRHEFQ